VAERMITELKGKVGALSASFPGSSPLVADMQSGQVPTASADAISALSNLGYGRAEAMQAVALALKQSEEGASSADLIRIGLQLMSK